MDSFWVVPLLHSVSDLCTVLGAWLTSSLVTNSFSNLALVETAWHLYNYVYKNVLNVL